MEFVTVSTSNNPAEAELVRSRLEANGFLVNLKNAEAAFSQGYVLAIGGVQVQVPEDQAENARDLLQSPDAPAT
jgi:Putative prokaryotic signal transducing protein